MKIQTTNTAKEDILLNKGDKLKDGSLRNKSRLFEYVLRQFLEEKR